MRADSEGYKLGSRTRYQAHLCSDLPSYPIDIAICLVAGVISIGWFEGLKLLNRRKQPALSEGSLAAEALCG